VIWWSLSVGLCEKIILISCAWHDCILATAELWAWAANSRGHSFLALIIIIIISASWASWWGAVIVRKTDSTMWECNCLPGF
jgi:hypothetical protein